MSIEEREFSPLMDQLQSLRIARYEFELLAASDAELPPFLGSALRGAFGHALKAITCSMPHGDCNRCLLVERCLYPRLFETTARPTRTNGLFKTRQDAPRPFIFIPPLPATDSGFLRGRDDLLRWRARVKKDEAIVFGLTLMGDAIDELPYIIHAIMAMSQNGLGASRAVFGLQLVSAFDAQGNRRLIFRNGMSHVIDHADCRTSLGRLVEIRLAQLFVAQAPACSASVAGVPATNVSVHLAANRRADDLTIEILTPARLRVKGRLIETPSFDQFVSSLSLRLSMLAETWAAAPLRYDYRAMIEIAREASTDASSLRLMALDRFSNRQGAKLELDGLMGRITFAGPKIKDLLPLLVAGEFINVGSGTAFGLGRYQLVPRQLV